MTFEFSAAHAAARDAARTFAEQLRPEAAAIDRQGAVDARLTRDAAPLLADDPLTRVLVLEEIAAVSPAVAAALVAPGDAPALDYAGLRGARVVDESPAAHLALAAVALGIARAAVAVALAELRAPAQTPAAVEKPQWVVADVATDLDAARLLTHKAAVSGIEAEIAIARLMASAAATRAVDAAVRVLGPSALAQGSVVERLSRDVRAVSVLLGTEEDQRAMAAAALLPS